MSFPLASVAAPDLSAEPEIVDGRRTYLVRARVPFAFSASLTDARVEKAAKPASRAEPATCADCSDGSCAACLETKAANPEGPDDPTNPGEQKIVKAEGEPAGPASTDGDGDGDGDGTMSADDDGMTLYGIASSTGVDTYGTEMSKRALDGMAAQFSSGEVCYLPAHPSWSGNGGEWDSVIGYVTKGEVVSAAVEKPAVGSEAAFALRVEVSLDGGEPMAEKLAARIGRGKKIGQSIGGWFTELRYVYAKDAGEWDPPERVIIEGVELDHLAATRRPSNGDSWIDGMRSAISGAHESAVTRAKASRPAPVVVVAAEPAPEPATEPGPDARNEHAPLDTESAPRHDSPDDAGREGQRASPGATEDGPSPTNTEELQMTPEALRAILDEKLAPLTSRLDAVEARTAVAPPPGTRAADPAPAPAAGDSAEVVALRARLAASEARTAGAYFGRKGHAGAGSFDRSVVEGVAEQALEGAPALAAVVRSKGFIDRRSVSHLGSTMDEQVAMRASLESDLNALINSAVDEGVIREPESDVGSWS